MPPESSEMMVSPTDGALNACLYIVDAFSPQPYELEMVIIPTSKMRKLRLRKAEKHALGQRASKWWG